MSFVSCACILSFMPRMDFLILKSSGLASSAISSSEMMHRLISSQSAEIGSILEKRPDRESCFSLSMPVLPYALVRLATSSRLHMRSSSVVLREPPISRRLRDACTLCTPTNEIPLSLYRRLKASAVVVCKCLIS